MIPFSFERFGKVVDLIEKEKLILDAMTHLIICSLRIKILMFKIYYTLDLLEFHVVSYSHL